ncbi:MAG: hypothetical protein MHPSP_000506 [Paramarteilia canceri]
MDQMLNLVSIVGLSGDVYIDEALKKCYLKERDVISDIETCYDRDKVFLINLIKNLERNHLCNDIFYEFNRFSNKRGHICATLSFADSFICDRKVWNFVFKKISREAALRVVLTHDVFVKIDKNAFIQLIGGVDYQKLKTTIPSNKSMVNSKYNGCCGILNDFIELIDCKHKIINCLCFFETPISIYFDK